MTKIKRETAGGSGKLGLQRYLRYVAAFDRVKYCIDEGYYLEAIAILDSLIWDRLSSRLGYLQGEEVNVRDTLNQVCTQLIGNEKQKIGKETNPEFQRVIKDIQLWTEKRNQAIHATAKVIRSDEAQMDFNELLESHQNDALEGVELLRLFDTLDTDDRKRQGVISATNPDAFFPEKRKPSSP